MFQLLLYPANLTRIVAIARIQKRNDSLTVAPEQLHNFPAPKDFRITAQPPTDQLMRVFRDLIIFRRIVLMRNNSEIVRHSESFVFSPSYFVLGTST
jgi:hypothetical protein